MGQHQLLVSAAASAPPCWRPAERDRLVARLGALAAGIHAIEGLFPSPIPGVKPGLANIIVIVALERYGWQVACYVAALRALAGSLLLGTFLSPTFLLSLSGALGSVLVLWPAPCRSRFLGPVGRSTLAAAAHIAAQFVTARCLFIPHEGLWGLFPIALSFSLVFGVINGIVCCRVLERMETTT